jgi:hypothetical protein
MEVETSAAMASQKSDLPGSVPLERAVFDAALESFFSEEEKPASSKRA